MVDLGVSGRGGLRFEVVERCSAKRSVAFANMQYGTAIS